MSRSDLRRALERLRSAKGLALAAAVAAIAIAGYAVLRGPGFIEAPAPETVPDVFPPAAPPPSTLSVPLRIPLGPLLQLVEDAVPVRYGSLDEMREVPENDRVKIAFELERTPFIASLVGDVARLETTILYGMRLSYALPALPDVGGSCGMDEARPRFSVVIESPLSLASDWSLQSDSRITQVSATSNTDRDKCEVTFLGIDVTGRIVDGVRAFLEESTPRIDELVAGVNTRSSFEGWWGTLREPIELTDSLWLAIQPERVQRGSIRGSGSSVVIDVALTARPRIVFGAQPESPEAPLPPLDSGSVEARLDLLVDGRALYAPAGRLLNERLAGTSLDYDGRTVTIDSLSVYGIGGGRLAMPVVVSGDVQARLFFTGRPMIDAATGVISVPDLDFDVATRDLIVSTVAWLSGPALREELRARARWPSEPAVDFLEGWLRSGLNRDISDELSVSGSVDTLRIVDAYALQEALLVRVAATGTATLRIDP